MEVRISPWWLLLVVLLGVGAFAAAEPQLAGFGRALKWIDRIPDPPPPNKRKPLLPWRDLAGAGGKAVVAGRAHEGEELACDLAGSLQFKNRGGSDGAGMCVMSSIEMAGLHQGVPGAKGLRDWCAKEPGGGYPDKVAKQIKAYYAAKNLPEPPYVQQEGKDPAELSALLSALDATGRMACVTYGTGERYNGQQIAHMVCSPKHGGKFGAILDNNFPGEDSYEWMDVAEHVRRISYPSGRWWVFAWLAPGPPPALWN